MSFWNDFAGPNAGYVLELYERYRRDPASVDAGTRAFFEHWTPPEATAQPDVPQADISRVVGAVNFARALREYGHLAARLDPLGTQLWVILRLTPRPMALLKMICGACLPA
ncbi:hypothetical protein QPK87_36540 [Kamptonema cortianum]|nr:hypothetical protein [Kamptonema cortianum]